MDHLEQGIGMAGVVPGGAVKPGSLGWLSLSPPGFRFLTCQMGLE